jgi:hypothetical protein
MAKKVLSPGQLKHWVEAKIKDIHESVDGAVQEEQVPSKKRSTAPTTQLITEKSYKTAASDEQDVTFDLLNLAFPPVPNLSLIARRIAKGRKTYTTFPTVDRSKGSKVTFFAGVDYALEDPAAGQRHDFHHSRGS